MTCRGVNHSGQHAPHFEKLPVVKLDAYRGSGERLSARIAKLGLALPFRAVCRQPVTEIAFARLPKGALDAARSVKVVECVTVALAQDDDRQLRHQRQQFPMMSVSSTFGELAAPLYLLLVTGVEQLFVGS